MRVERVVLKDHRDVALAGLDVVDAPVADADFAGGDFLEPREHAERRALAAAGRADQDDELAVADLEIEIPHGVEAVGVVLVDVSEIDGSHFGCSSRRRNGTRMTQIGRIFADQNGAMISLVSALICGNLRN